MSRQILYFAKYSLINAVFRNDWMTKQLNKKWINEGSQKWIRMNECGFQSPMCTSCLNWARETSWGWWHESDDITGFEMQDMSVWGWTRYFPVTDGHKQYLIFTSGRGETTLINKWNESGFRPPLCTYRLNWARRTSWGWWDDWDDTVLQTQDSKFEPWRSEAEHATSRSRRFPTILSFTRGWGRNIFCFLQFAETGNRTPNSGVKGSGANHYPRAPAQLPWWHRKALTQWPPLLNVLVLIRSKAYACWKWPSFRRHLKYSSQFHGIRVFW